MAPPPLSNPRSATGPTLKPKNLKKLKPTLVRSHTSRRSIASSLDFKWTRPNVRLPGLSFTHGRRSLRKSRGDKNRFPLDREIVLKIAKNSFTVVIVDKGLCNVSAVRFYQEIMNGHDRS